MQCKELSGLLKEQTKIISRHLEDHQYFQHIEDTNKAALDFIDKYGWVMREVYCDNCSENKFCYSYQQYITTKQWKKRQR